MKRNSWLACVLHDCMRFIGSSQYVFYDGRDVNEERWNGAESEYDGVVNLRTSSWIEIYELIWCRTKRDF